MSREPEITVDPKKEVKGRFKIAERFEKPEAPVNRESFKKSLEEFEVKKSSDSSGSIWHDAVTGDESAKPPLEDLETPQEEAFNSSLAASSLGTDATDSDCLLYTSPSPRDLSTSRMPSSA